MHAADLEKEMIKRGMHFTMIDWGDAHEELRFDR
jgi:hypothetical protein